MKKILILFFIFVISISFLFSQDTTEKGKKAKALVEKAVKFYMDNGEAKAFEAFNDPKGAFVDGELYLFVYDFKGKCVAHGADKTMIGKDLINLKDANGKMVVKDFIDLVKSKNEGWIDFIWVHPQTKKNMPKRSFVKRIGSKELVVGCGYYFDK